MNSATGMVLPVAPQATERGPLAQLLHALNQPLTGLQCSMEVALASPRTVEQYRNGLRAGLELTERMRTLVEAIREVTDLQDEHERTPIGEKDELNGVLTDVLTEVLTEVLEDLRPVAETRAVHMVEASLPSGLMVKVSRARLRAGIFRMLESVLTLADSGTVIGVEVEVVCQSGEVRLHIRWHGCREELRSLPSRAEVGMLIARARLEHCGAEWGRELAKDGERLVIIFRDGLVGGRKSSDI